MTEDKANPELTKEEREERWNNYLRRRRVLFDENNPNSLDLYERLGELIEQYIDTRASEIAKENSLQPNEAKIFTLRETAPYGLYHVIRGSSSGNIEDISGSLIWPKWDTPNEDFRKIFEQVENEAEKQKKEPGKGLFGE